MGGGLLTQAVLHAHVSIHYSVLILLASFLGHLQPLILGRIWELGYVLTHLEWEVQTFIEMYF